MKKLISKTIGQIVEITTDVPWSHDVYLSVEVDIKPKDLKRWSLCFYIWEYVGDETKMRASEDYSIGDYIRHGGFDAEAILLSVNYMLRAWNDRFR